MAGDARVAFFWEDNWINGQSVPEIAPTLSQLVTTRTRRLQTVRQGLTDRQWIRAINGGLSIPAIVEYLTLWDSLEPIVLNDQLDATIWRWTPSGSFTVKSAYTMLYKGAIQFSGQKLIWKTWAPLKVNIFLWLAFLRRHWTGDRRARHGLEAREYGPNARNDRPHHRIIPYTKEVWTLAFQALG